MAKKRRKKEQQQQNIPIPFSGLIRFFLGTKKRLTLSGLAGTVVAVSVAWPIMVSWGKSGRNVLETGLTLNVSAEVETVKKEQQKIMTAHGLMNQSIGHIRDSQKNLQQQQYQMWSDIRDMRGMDSPPTPVPIPTFIPTPVALIDGP